MFSTSSFESRPRLENDRINSSRRGNFVAASLAAVADKRKHATTSSLSWILHRRRRRWLLFLAHQYCSHHRHRKHAAIAATIVIDGVSITTNTFVINLMPHHNHPRGTMWCSVYPIIIERLGPSDSRTTAKTCHLRIGQYRLTTASHEHYGPVIFNQSTRQSVAPLIKIHPRGNDFDQRNTSTKGRKILQPKEVLTSFREWLLLT